MARVFQALRMTDVTASDDRSPFVLSDTSAQSFGDIPTAESVLAKIDEVEREMAGMRNELNVLRRRDETLNLYMQRIDDELRLAARLQQDFLPKTLPQLGNVRFNTLFRPAGYVSGDLYDVMRLDESHVGFYIADAVGHGMPAALLTMFIKHALETKEIGPGGYRLLRPSESLSRLNAALVDQNLSNATFATAIYGMINIRTLQLTLSCAGHPVPEMLRENGTLEPLPCYGALLGIFPDEIYTDFSMQLHPGDRMILYTDGVEVAFEEPASCDPNRWRNELVDRRSLPSDELLAQFADSADKESGSLEPNDDLTMVIVDIER